MGTIEETFQQIIFFNCSVAMHGSITIYGYRVMVFNATFNNLSVILWQSVLLASVI